ITTRATLTPASTDAVASSIGRRGPVARGSSGTPPACHSWAACGGRATLTLRLMPKVPTAVEIAESVRRGERLAVEVLDEALANIDAANPRLNAFVHIDAGGAKRSAEAVDATVAAGRDPGPFSGVPFGIKDLEHGAGMPTSFGSLL